MAMVKTIADPETAMSAGSADSSASKDYCVLVNHAFVDRVQQALGGRIVVVEGDAVNRKITVPADLEWARTEVAS